MTTAKKEPIKQTPPEKPKAEPTTKKGKLEKAIDDGQGLKPLKRVRRTREQLKEELRKQEQRLLSDDNHEVFTGVLKLLSDWDASKFNIEQVNKSTFEPLAKSYAIIANYFLPNGKPIYFVIASATFQTIAMMSERKRKIDVVLEKNPKPGAEPSKPEVSPGKVRVGEELPGQTPVKKL